VLSGPRSRDVLAKLTDSDLSNEAFRWMRAKTIKVSGISVRALRVSYVGELGWELHHPIEKMEALYDSLMEAGVEYGIANFGTYAMNSLRMEKAYKGWGSELTTEITPIEAGLERFVDFSKSFLGREAAISANASSDAKPRFPANYSALTQNWFMFQSKPPIPIVSATNPFWVQNPRCLAEILSASLPAVHTGIPSVRAWPSLTFNLNIPNPALNSIFEFLAKTALQPSSRMPFMTLIIYDCAICDLRCCG